MSTIKAVIIDDEPAAIDVIKVLTGQLATDVEIRGVAMNGIDAIKVIIEQQPDLVFLDIDIPLMNGVQVMEKLPEKKFRTIFTTGSAAYALNAIKLDAVDYLLKPIDPADFMIAINKVRTLFPKTVPGKKMRLLVKKGLESISKPLTDIALFYTEKRMVYAIDKIGKKFMIDKNMNELEMVLDHSIFFRANRQCIVNIDFIKHFKPYEKVKLLLELNVPEVNHIIIISQKGATEFRSWISGR